MPKGKGYPKKSKKSTTTTSVKRKKKSALQEIKDRARKNRDALNFE